MQMCDVLGYSRQAYYKQLRQRSEWAVKAQVITESVRQIRASLPQTGTVKILEHCRSSWDAQGIKIGRDKTYQLLREQGLLLRKRRSKKPKTTWSNHWLKRYPDLVKHHRFTKPNQLWVSDITYVNVDQAWCYLFLITDAVSRKIVGYHLSRRIDTSSAISALKMAINQNQVTHALIHHSDRGIQYCSKRYTRLLEQHNIGISMTQSGSPYDNAIAERINGIIKNELIYPFGKLTCLKDAKKRVIKAVESYNSKRLHQSLNYQTPNRVHLNCKPIEVLKE